MTIQQLLRHHGHNCSRRVLPSGRVIFEAAGSKSTSVASIAVGYPMTSHTFHGGDESKDAPALIPWWMDENALDNDRAEMAKYFPSFNEVAGDADSIPAWCGSVETRVGAFRVAIVHRFDHSLPTVVPLSPERRGRQRGRRFETAPHTYTNGNLCVAAVDDWDKARDSIATVVAWTAHWHAFYVEWFFTGRWPAEAYVAEAA